MARTTSILTQAEVEAVEYLASLGNSLAVVTDASGLVVSSSATATEVGYLSGVTSAIQTQLNAKPDLNDNNTWTGTNLFTLKVAIGENDAMTINGSATTALFAVHVDGSAATQNAELHRHSTNATGPIMYGAKSRGSSATPLIVADGDATLSIYGVGYDGTDYATSAAIHFEVDGTPGSNDMPGRIVFQTASDGSQTLTEAMRIDSTQSVHIGGTTGTDTLNIHGDVDIIHTAAETDDHALEIDVNAAGFGDVKAIDIAYTTGAISTGEDEGVILINIDESTSTGGEVFGLEVLTTDFGSTAVYALKAGIDVNVISHDSGTFANPSSASNDGADVLAAISSGGAGNITMFVADDDFLTIGKGTQFDEMEILIDIAASGSGIAPTFEYSTGVGTWAFFTPTDGTNGFRNTGSILWDPADLSGWMAGAGAEFLIRITRTRNTLATSPRVDTIQVASAVIYTWDKNGVITGNTIEATGDTAADDNAAMGYTATEGLILTGQGSVTDVTIKNDADVTVLSILTGTDDVTFADDLLLSSGAVLNFNAGNYTMTHSAGLLTLSGDLTVQTNMIIGGNATAASVGVEFGNTAGGTPYFDFKRNNVDYDARLILASDLEMNILFRQAGSSFGVGGNIYSTGTLSVNSGTAAFSATNAGVVNVGYTALTSAASITITADDKAFISLVADTSNTDEAATAYIKYSQDGAGVVGWAGYAGNINTLPDGTTLTGIPANSFVLGASAGADIGYSMIGRKGSASTIYYQVTPTTGAHTFNATATTTAGVTFNHTNTTADALTVTGTTSTTGSTLVAYDNSADTGTRNVFLVHADNAAATGVTALRIINDSTGNAATISGGATTGNGLFMQFDSLTTGSALKVYSNSSSASTRDLVLIHNDNTSASAATCLKLTQDAAAYALNIAHTANAQTIHIESSATTSDVYSSTSNSLTTGGAAVFYSASTSSSTRVLVQTHNANASATGATPLGLYQTAVTSTNFKRYILLDSITIWTSHTATSPNGALSGSAGDMCLSTNGNIYRCTGTTSWTAM